MTKIVLLRHGESEWNQDDRFAGWVDVALTPRGVDQARHAGLSMQASGLDFDRVYTSVLRRTTQTAWHCLDAMDRTWLPAERSWQLNERHYGALQGLNKSDTTQRFGEAQVRQWRRSYATRPPPQSADAMRLLAEDRRYAGIDVPASESLADTVVRVAAYWNAVVRPAAASGARALVIAHGTSLRALIKILCDVSEATIVRIEIPNGVPLVIDLDAALPRLLPAPLRPA
ncbi:2,3-bisphosphoglycerate-dependent phosphoglycerate mutase [Variovorax rhizosphaerae]|uniref:2,3-bisphosphoglycerate-dependent phosphoglycerate mutase n=1 Tax=Variovorax rhizosphaerae TaxID=1836200 RepID=A0ABU8WV82_9BURK